MMRLRTLRAEVITMFAEPPLVLFTHGGPYIQLQILAPSLPNVSCFGFRYGEFGQLGHGDYNNEYVPSLVHSLAGVRVGKVACGSCHTVAILRSGDVYVWGKGS